MGGRGLNVANRLFVIKLKGFVKNFFFCNPKNKLWPSMKYVQHLNNDIIYVTKSKLSAHRMVTRQTNDK